MWRVRKSASAADTLAEALRLLAQGTPKEHAAFAEAAVRTFPNDPDLRHQYAITLIATHPEQARMEVLRAVEFDRSGDAVRLVRAAGVLLELDDYENALALAERAAPQATSLPVINKLRRIRGVVAVQNRDFELAAKELGDAHKSDPAEEFAARDLAWALVRMGKPDEALAVVDRTLGTPVGGASHDRDSRALLVRFRERVERTKACVDGRDPSSAAEDEGEQF